MRAVLLLFPALLFANGFMRTSQHRREENYLGSGRQRDTPTIKANMISTALHMFSPDVNESAPGALSLFGIEKVEYHLTSDRSSSKEAYDIDCNSTDPAIDSTVVSCKEKIRCARNFSELDLELVPSTYSKNNLNVLNWFCNKGEHCCELECCTYKSKTGLIFGLFVIGTVMLIGVIICLVRALESVRENRRMEQYVKQVQAVYRANDGGRVDVAT